MPIPNFYPGQTIVYTKHMVVSKKLDKVYQMLARYHGPCPRSKASKCKSDITIIYRGRPKRMKFVNNCQLMGLMDWQMRRK